MFGAQQCAALAEQRLSGRERSLEAEPEWRGLGDELELQRLEYAALEINDLLPRERRAGELDQVEGQAAVVLYKALEGVPEAVLDDRGFWRYLSLAIFWDFIEWREQDPFRKGNHITYIDPERTERNVDAVLFRMFLRIAALGGVEHAELSWAVQRGSDFWSSHILRVRTGTAPALTRALVRFQARHQLRRDDIREVAKRLSRVWTNTVLTMYDDDEADELIAELAEDFVDQSGQDA